MTVIFKITNKEATSALSSQLTLTLATGTEASIFPKATEICSQFIQVPRQRRHMHEVGQHRHEI